MYIEVFAMIIHTIIIYLLLQGGFLDKEAYSETNLLYAVLLLALSTFQSLVEVNIMNCKE